MMRTAWTAAFAATLLVACSAKSDGSEAGASPSAKATQKASAAEDAAEAREHALHAEWVAARNVLDGSTTGHKDPSDVFRTLTRIADANVKTSPYAKVDLAEMHYYGFGTQRDAARAAQLVRSVVETTKPGDTLLRREAHGLLGWLLFHGDGVPRDEAAAVRLWQAADKLGVVHRADYLAGGLTKAYFLGKGVPKDLDRARQARTKTLDYFNDPIQTKLGAEGLEGDGRCPDHNGKPDELLSRWKAAVHRPLFAEAEGAMAACYFKLAKREKGALREMHLVSAREALVRAESLGFRGGAAAAAIYKANGIAVGMTEEEVLKSVWGKPQQVNRTITARGTSEQWVYSGGYLYFNNGVLTTIQN